MDGRKEWWIGKGNMLGILGVSFQSDMNDDMMNVFLPILLSNNKMLV